MIVTLGDMTGDGLVDPDDVPAFVLALVDPLAYDVLYPFVSEELAGDVDGSGTFDLGDLADFSALLGGPASADAIPEPSALSLAVVLLLGIAIRQRRRG